MKQESKQTMNSVDRPTQITTILTTINAEGSADMSAELEAYIADLEAKQPARPARITAILSTIGSQYSAEVRRSLETYLTDLEARQQTVQLGGTYTPARDPDNLPIWSYERVLKREQRRREQAIKKQNNYR